jgi:rhodanese-related sulfurtransferase
VIDPAGLDRRIIPGGVSSIIARFARQEEVPLNRLGFLLMLFAAAVQAADPAAELSAPDALAAMQAGKLTLVDIRTPEEWRETGVAKGVTRINMLDPQFEPKLRAVLHGDKAAPVAIICRTGNRTTMVQRWLRQQGYTKVYNVSEGMAGSRSGPGWIARRLPLDACRSC